jgi:hypothetical protein
MIAMYIFFTIIGILFALYLLDRLGLWFERKGWLYYRREKPESSVVGSVLQELNGILNLRSRHVIEMKQSEAKYKKSEAHAPNKPTSIPRGKHE